MSKRIAVFVYGVACYLAFLITFPYAVGFLGNLLLSSSIDAEPRTSTAHALLIDTLLLAVFALQHSGMARQGFKKYVPHAIERPTYVLLSSVALLVLFWNWEPIGGVVWKIDSPALRTAVQCAFAGGWLLVLATTFLINHFDLFGLRQSWFYLQGRPYEPVGFRTPALYKVVRHPLYVGWLTVFWSAPLMTGAHLLFAMGSTAYILIAIRLEERDLRRMHPEYNSYAERVPMLIPGAKAAPRLATESAGTKQSAGARG